MDTGSLRLDIWIYRAAIPEIYLLFFLVDKPVGDFSLFLLHSGYF